MNHRRWALWVCVAMLVALVGNASAQQGTPPDQPQAPASPVTTAFTYQGQVKKNGGAYTGACDFKFSLWDAANAGAQQGTTQNAPGVNVANGLFTVELNFGDQFKGDARWLEIAVDCGDGAFTTMTPRILMTSSPYALGVRPGAQISGTLAGPAGILRATNVGEGAALVGLAYSGTGVTYGVLGNAFSPNGYAVWGYANGGATGVAGVSASSGNGVYGSTAAGKAGVLGLNTNAAAYSVGVLGQSDAASTFGVYGSSANGTGVWGQGAVGPGVVGASSSNIGVWGDSTSFDAVWGIAHAANKVGVLGRNDAGIGVYGTSAVAHTYDLAGVSGVSTGDGGIGVKGTANTGTGAYGVYGVSHNGYGVVGQSQLGYAGYFIGKVGIQGGADLAELFDLSDQSEPGTLMVIDETNPGQLKASDQAYDTRVAGIVSGAGGVNPGLTLHQDGVLKGDTHVAIAGRVYVKAEAFSTPIKPGDLLTTSSLKGYAMKATDRERAQGAIIGKAMTGLDSGTGLVLVLVNLQ